MKNWTRGLKVVGGLSLLILISGACHNEMGRESLLVKSEASLSAAEDNHRMIGTMQDMAVITASAFTSQGIVGARTMDGDDELSEDETGCKPSINSNIKLDRSRPDTVIYSGVIVIDFGTGANCADSVEMRKGKIIDSVYVIVTFKDSVYYKSMESITFIGYQKDSVQLDGSLSILDASNTPLHIALHGTRTKFSDGTSSEWKGDLVFTVNKQAASKHHSFAESISITGSWSGVSRMGQAFSAVITSPIEYQTGCFGHSHKPIPVSGKIDVTVGGVTSTIDYGTGVCDKTYTITTAGTTKDYKFS